MALLRAKHETILLNLAEMVKYSQWQDAIKSRQALEQSLANATERYTYYQLLLGQSTSQINNSIPQIAALDTGGLQNLSFSQAGEDAEPEMTFQSITVDIKFLIGMRQVASRCKLLSCSSEQRFQIPGGCTVPTGMRLIL
jgi:hypothetical protein